MDLQTLATAWHECVVGKSSGRFGRLRIFISGTRPFCVTNSRQWSSVVLLLRMASTNFICINNAVKTKQKAVLSWAATILNSTAVKAIIFFNTLALTR